MSYVAWEFKTARFMVRLHIEEEDMAPDFDDAETIADIEAGRVEWFQAHVAVYLDGSPVGDDYLGGCAYKSIEEFYTAHRDPDPMNRNCTAFRAVYGGSSVCHYFPDMVREACRLTRERIAEIGKIQLRR